MVSAFRAGVPSQISLTRDPQRDFGADRTGMIIRCQWPSILHPKSGVTSGWRRIQPFCGVVLLKALGRASSRLETLSWWRGQQSASAWPSSRL